jgi:hypothetical protein
MSHSSERYGKRRKIKEKIGGKQYIVTMLSFSFSTVLIASRKSSQVSYSQVRCSFSSIGTSLRVYSMSTPSTLPILRASHMTFVAHTFCL